MDWLRNDLVANAGMAVRKFLIFILGPTGVGKTELSVFLARKYDAEIFSADARQFFKELNIGTAKPSKEVLASVKHHFIDSLSIHACYSVGKFEGAVIQKLDSYFQQKDIAILVGGSGLYINAVCEGIDPMPDIDKNIRAGLNKTHKENGIKPLLEQLEKLDPAYYREVDRSNPQRIIRALEVCIATGKSFSALRTHSKKGRNFIPIKIGLNIARAVLYEKINKRVDKMIDAGLVEEAKQLHPYRGLNALETVGYCELFDYFEGRHDMHKAIELIKTNSRRYAKRQLTWFNKDKSIQWFEPEESEISYQLSVISLREKIVRYIDKEIKNANDKNRTTF